VSAECYIHGCDLVYPEGSWPVGECPECRYQKKLDEAWDIVGAILYAAEGDSSISTPVGYRDSPLGRALSEAKARLTVRHSGGSE
jgi:hypothetical protein